VEQYPHAGATKGVLILRVVGPLCFANVEHIKDSLAEHEVGTRCFVFVHQSIHPPIYGGSCFVSQHYKGTMQATTPQATISKPAMTCRISCVSCYILTMLALSNNFLSHSSHTANTQLVCLQPCCPVCVSNQGHHDVLPTQTDCCRQYRYQRVSPCKAFCWMSVVPVTWTRQQQRQ